MDEFPLNKMMFDQVRAQYAEDNGSGTPVLNSSSATFGERGQYVILRNAEEQELAVYRYEDDFAQDKRKIRIIRVDWPEPAYILAPKEHVHAIGAISVNYSALESIFRLFFWTYTGLRKQVSDNLFVKISNEIRINTIRDALVDCDHPTSVKENVEYFLRAFMTIFSARNSLMHATPRKQDIYPEAEDPMEISIELFRVSRDSPVRPIRFAPTLAELRAIADSAHAFRVYGSNLQMHIMLRYENDILEQMLAVFSDPAARRDALDFVNEHGYTLPDKPPLPVPLSPHSPEAPKE